MKRILKIFGVLFVLIVCLGIASFVMFRQAGQAGSGLIEQWIGSQLQLIAGSYLNPTLTFTDLDYEAPRTVSLQNLRLTASDPANPEKMIEILGCGKAVLTLGEIPTTGKPIVIEKIILDKPLFSAIAVEPHSREFIGFSNLIRRRAGAEKNAPTQPVASTPPPSSRPSLSDVFRIRLIQLNDGKVVYDPRIPGTVAMTLDQINTSLDITPTEPGWYKVSTAISRKPIFAMSVDGHINLDKFSARDMTLKLLADLSQDKLDYLPPQTQEFLRKYEVKGVLDAKIAANEIQVMDPLKGKLQADIKLTQANVTLGEYRIPIDNMELSARMENSKATLPKLSIAALKGTAELTGSADLYDKINTDLKLNITGMLLQELLAGRKDGEPLKLAGKLDADVQVTAPLMVVLAKTLPASTQPSSLATERLADNWGSGTLNLNDARLVRIPIIHYLTDAIGAVSKIVPNSLSKDLGPREKFNLMVVGSQDQINVEDFNYIGDVVAARGKGTISLEQQLDLKVNGGPVERVQALLGKHVGGLFGKVTDQLVGYLITGTMSQPKIRVEVGNGVIANTTRIIGNGAEKVGEGVGKIGQSIGQGIENIFKKDEQK